MLSLRLVSRVPLSIPPPSPWYSIRSTSSFHPPCSCHSLRSFATKTTKTTTTATATTTAAPKARTRKTAAKSANVNVATTSDASTYTYTYTSTSTGDPIAAIPIPTTTPTTTTAASKRTRKTSAKSAAAASTDVSASPSASDVTSTSTPTPTPPPAPTKRSRKKSASNPTCTPATDVTTSTTPIATSESTSTSTSTATPTPAKRSRTKKATPAKDATTIPITTTPVAEATETATSPSTSAPPPAPTSDTTSTTPTTATKRGRKKSNTPAPSTPSNTVTPTSTSPSTSLSTSLSLSAATFTHTSPYPSTAESRTLHPPDLAMCTKKTSHVIHVTDQPLIREFLPTPENRSSRVEPLATALRPVLSAPGAVFVQPNTTIGAQQGTKLEFDPYWHKIHAPERFRMSQLGSFVTSSRDPALIKLAVQHHAHVMTSTSSVTNVLCHMHFAMLNFMPFKLGDLSPVWHSDAIDAGEREYSKYLTAPTSVILRQRHYNGELVWGMDRTPEPYKKPNQILISLGHSMEKMMTMEPEAFVDRWVKTEDEVDEEATEGQFQGIIFQDAHGNDTDLLHGQAFSYLKMGNILLRSQLDCHDESVKGPLKTFDLKTRAVRPTRHDILNYMNHLGYRIDYINGKEWSFEREFFDMCRTAFLKYSLQCRIGHMSGIFVSYHNTDTVFGFEFITVDKMDRHMTGSPELSEHCFDHSIKLLNLVNDAIISRHGHHPSIKVTYKAFQGYLPSNQSSCVDIYVETPLPKALDTEDDHMPWQDRYSSLMAVDTMSREELKIQLRALGLSEEKHRSDAIRELEGRAAIRHAWAGLNLSHHQKLAAAGHLTKYRLEVVTKINGIPQYTKDIKFKSGDSFAVDVRLYQVEIPAKDMAREYNSWHGKKRDEDFLYSFCSPQLRQRLHDENLLTFIPTPENPFSPKAMKHMKHYAEMSNPNRRVKKMGQ